MKLSIQATPDELADKSEQLIKALSELFRFSAPDISESLEKALPPKEQALKYPVLRELQKQTQVIYEQHIKKMLKEVVVVLGQGLTKSLEKSQVKDLEYDHTKPIAEKDDVGYVRVKKILEGFGYKESDFEENGPLYGWSTNQLIDLARDSNKD